MSTQGFGFVYIRLQNFPESTHRKKDTKHSSIKIIWISLCSRLTSKHIQFLPCVELREHDALHYESLFSIID